VGRDASQFAARRGYSTDIGIDEANEVLHGKTAEVLERISLTSPLCDRHGVRYGYQATPKTVFKNFRGSESRMCRWLVGRPRPRTLRRGFARCYDTGTVPVLVPARAFYRRFVWPGGCSSEYMLYLYSVPLALHRCSRNIIVDTYRLFSHLFVTFPPWTRLRTIGGPLLGVVRAAYIRLRTFSDGCFEVRTVGPLPGYVPRSRGAPLIVATGAIDFLRRPVDASDLSGRSADSLLGPQSPCNPVYSCSCDIADASGTEVWLSTSVEVTLSI
jgi:hypothetical protein